VIEMHRGKMVRVRRHVEQVSPREGRSQTP
jgi:hypothetical protein